MKRLLFRGVALCALAACGPALALDAELVGSGFDQPVFVTAPSGDSRLFVVERTGRIKLMNNGSVSTYLDLSAQVDTTGERGLLGLAFDPGFASNGKFYVNYIDKTTKNTVVASYRAPSAGSSTADAASARTVITVEQPDFGNHKAGWIGFRSTDPGQLYVATGDGGGANDPGNRAQNLDSNLGKILRITPGAEGGYTAPSDNPYAGATPGNDEIWSYGLRNPFRASFDRQTGDFWIADVGQGTREEIDFEAAGTPGGRNYGWRPREGSVDNPDVPDPAPADAVDPLFDYEHGELGRSVIGGYVYRGGLEPGLDGTYFFGDFVSGKIFSLRRQGNSFVDFIDRTAELGTPFGASQLASFGEDGFGALYAVGLNGEIYRIAGAVPEPGQWLMISLGGMMLLGVMRRRRARD
ncbi:PQQ-dependent sugar dehydrogenase [Eleftheria terrae]|uniref:PQQ-dependent sugar dehydrogenase n=1 Tax=Eleftheria terrae TaxID=1597781 RepID=UPI00263A4B58|nr:PQQ-dependent sugar dehydrogenase [Eleftheria terrae]WKB54981.1 PQQ-dependent sugar dehydrogenase [Eleftheria terrae]